MVRATSELQPVLDAPGSEQLLSWTLLLVLENTGFPTPANLAALKAMVESHTVTYVIVAVDAESTATVGLLANASYHVQILQCNVMLDGDVVFPNARLDSPEGASRLGQVRGLACILGTLYLAVDVDDRVMSRLVALPSSHMLWVGHRQANPYVQRCRPVWTAVDAGV